MKTTEHYLYTDITGNKVSIRSYEFGNGEPMLYLQGGIHGGEVTYFIFQKLYEYIKSIENLLTFKVLMLPMVNPISWQQRVYYYPVGKFSLQSGQDFNRHYSEKEYEEGNVAKKLANLLRNLSEDYKIAFDFHTARCSKPYLYVEDRSLISLANLIGLNLNLFDFEINPTEFSGYYVNKMRQNSNSTKAFTIECGTHDDYSEQNITEVTKSIIRLLNKLLEVGEKIFECNFENESITFCLPQKWIYSAITGFAKFYKQPNELCSIP